MDPVTDAAIFTRHWGAVPGEAPGESVFGAGGLFGWHDSTMQGNGSSRCVEVVVTGPVGEQLVGIVSTLVNERIIACAQVVPQVRSIFRWDGAVADEPESRAHLHTVEHLVPKLTRRVRDMHPYDVPCVIAMPLVGGDEEYLAWIVEETTGP